MAQAEPPFADVDPRQIGDRWPPVYQPDEFSPSFHDFLLLCSEPAASRPTPEELLQSPFIQGASGRAALCSLLAECRTIEARFSRRESADSGGTVSMS